MGPDGAQGDVGALAVAQDDDLSGVAIVRVLDAPERRVDGFPSTRAGASGSAAP